MDVFFKWRWSFPCKNYRVGAVLLKQVERSLIIAI